MTNRAILLPGIAASVAAARRFAIETGRAQGVPQAALEQVALVVSELVTNAIQASPGREFELIVDGSGPELIVEVWNRSLEADIPERSDWKPSDPLAIRGRGLGIVDELTAAVDIDTYGDLVRVRATLRLAGGVR